jgi:F0F1-type ATP synthase assembly protein I
VDKQETKYSAGDQRVLTALGLVGRLGLVVAAGPLMGVGAGLMMKRWMGTGDAVLVAALLIGLAAGLFAAYATLAKECRWNH